MRHTNLPNSAKREKMRQDIKRIFDAALQAVDPVKAVKRYVRVDPHGVLIIVDNEFPLINYDHIYIIGIGKAAALMAAAVESVLKDRIQDGIVIVKYDHSASLKYVQLIEAGHPIPDESGMKGAKAVLSLIRRSGRRDLIIALISGGGSALMSLPVSSVTLPEKQTLNNVLLNCGVRIHDINTLRKHVSQVKGGRLAQAAFPATVVSLVLSDVIGDNLDVIASGPFSPDGSTFKDCIRILDHYALKEQIPASILTHLLQGLESPEMETPKPDDPIFQNIFQYIIGGNFQALAAAESTARQLGYNSLILTSMLEGETRHVARVHAAIAKQMIQSGHPVSPPACLLTGGETTVTVKGSGLGGRNQEFALAASFGIDQLHETVILSAGTDGTDGPTDAAGAIIDATTISRARRMGLDPYQHLIQNDAYHFFDPLNDLIRIGPTKTNVMDIQVVLADV